MVNDNKSKVDKSFRSINLKLPIEIIEDLQSYSKINARNLKDELIARLKATLKNNEDFMSGDRLLRLIFSRKLAYKKKKEP